MAKRVKYTRNPLNVAPESLTTKTKLPSIEIWHHAYFQHYTLAHFEKSMNSEYACEVQNVYYQLKIKSINVHKKIIRTKHFSFFFNEAGF
jgi:hypothetical protein